MIQTLLFRILMAPFALLYGCGIFLRNLFYQIGILKEVRFNLPIISVGNLTVGGTGKTPHVEYLLQWLSEYLNIAVLSRGYKRKTKGFLEVTLKSNADISGDEPLQYKRKYPEAGIYVSESRVLGVPKIMSLRPDVQLILLDDAFQHRAIKPDINILLTEYRRLFTSDFLLPMGRLREWRNAYKRADIIIVTKCPMHLPAEDRQKIIHRIGPEKKQKLFFTTYQYHSLYHLLYPHIKINLQPDMHALIICAIANTEFLIEYLEGQVESVHIMEYEDHHDFSSYEIAQLKAQYDATEEKNKIIITTEKDAVRLEKHLDYLRKEQLPVFVLPAFVSFLEGEEDFQSHIKQLLLDFKS